MAARDDLPLAVRRRNQLVAAARMRCAACDTSWQDAGERWLLIATPDESAAEHVLLCPTCNG